jgi:hypothetical protein
VRPSDSTTAASSSGSCPCNTSADLLFKSLHRPLILLFDFHVCWTRSCTLMGLVPDFLCAAHSRASSNFLPPTRLRPKFSPTQQHPSSGPGQRRSIPDHPLLVSFSFANLVKIISFKVQLQMQSVIYESCSEKCKEFKYAIHTHVCVSHHVVPM